MPGFGFSLTVSKHIPANYRQHCFVHGPGNPIVVTDLIEKSLEADAVKLRQKGLSTTAHQLSSDPRTLKPKKSRDR
jgi:hypothetical protein